VPIKERKIEKKPRASLKTLRVVKSAYKIKKGARAGTSRASALAF